jgi:hypothetical protein
VLDDGLRHAGRQAAGLQLGQRGVKYPFR